MSEPRLARDIAGLGRLAGILLLVQAGFAVLSVAIALSHGPGFSEANPAYGVVALLQVIAFVAAGFVFLRWTYFVTANAHAFGAQALRFGPWLAVGSYFIPIANLVMPLQALRDAWKASVEPRDWEVVSVPATLDFWWFFWVTGNIAGIAAFRLADAERYPGMSRTPETLTVVSDSLTVAASLLLAVIVRGLTALQQTRVAAAHLQ